MAQFKKLNTKVYYKNQTLNTPDYLYWKKLGVPVLVKEFGPIDYIDFSPIEPYYFAVTCSVRVQLYNPVTKLVAKNLSRFRENAYGASFRNDGKLLCSGGEEAAVKLFDVASKSLLRLFNGHTASVHRTFFVPNKAQIASFSDDKSVKLWDIPTEQAIKTYTDHNDYIRAGATNPNHPDIILSGSYDHIVKMYDTRTDNHILSVNHGSPIESLIYLPSGGVFLSAGGTDIKIWDAMAGGKLLGCVSQHHKTITCLRLASDNKRLLSGSLDRHIKIYDIATFSVVHSIKYPNAVLSLDISKNDETLVAGLVDGLVSVSRREEDKQQETNEMKPKSISYQYTKNTFHKVDEVVKDNQLVVKDTNYNISLRKFRYRKALSIVLHSHISRTTPDVTVTVLHELYRRKALHKIFEDQDWKQVLSLVRFFTRNLPDIRFTKVLLPIVNHFLDSCSNVGDMPRDVVIAFLALKQLVKDEVNLNEQLSMLKGAMEMILAASTTSSDVIKCAPQQNLRPSADAQKNLVVTIS